MATVYSFWTVVNWAFYKALGSATAGDSILAANYFLAGKTSGDSLRQRARKHQSNDPDLGEGMGHPD